MLDKPQKGVCRSVGPTLTDPLEHLAHRRNMFTVTLFDRYQFRRCSVELAELVPLPCSHERSTYYSDRLHDFSVICPRFYKEVFVKFFLRTAC